MLPLDRAADARPSGSCSGVLAPRGRLAARRAAARSGSPTRSPRTCARSAARSRPAAASTRSPSSAPARPILLDVTPRQLLALAGDRLPAALPPRGSSATATGRACSSSTGRSTGRSPGGRRSAARRRPSTSARTLEEIVASERAPWHGEVARAAVRAARPAEPLRPDARAGGQADRLGLLPRPERLDAST